MQIDLNSVSKRLDSRSLVLAAPGWLWQRMADSLFTRLCVIAFLVLAFRGFYRHGPDWALWGGTLASIAIGLAMHLCAKGGSNTSASHK